MFYTGAMLRGTAFLCLIFALIMGAPCLSAAEKPYATGKFLDIQPKTRDRVDLYVVNTPITSAVPYFEVSVEFGSIDYVAEYTPRHSSEELPEAWRPGENVQGRVEKHFIYLKRPDGTEMKFLIDKRTAAKPGGSRPE
jgi:hypothetical protein